MPPELSLNQNKSVWWWPTSCSTDITHRDPFKWGTWGFQSPDALTPWGKERPLVLWDAGKIASIIQLESLCLGRVLWIITAVKQLGHINTHSECGQCRFTSHTDEGSSLPQMEKDEGKKWEAEKRVPEACTDEAWRSPSLYWRQQRGRSKQPSIM